MTISARMLNKYGERTQPCRTPFLLKLHKSQTGGKGIVKICTVMRKGKELNKSIESKSLHHFVQRLLVASVRQQVVKPQVLMRSQQNC